MSAKYEMHGLSSSREWNVWSLMKSRCTNPANPAYARYGGRGISVCARWRKSFLSFYEDMGPVPEGMELDRIDNNGDYCQENCRWATPQQNSNNRRSNRLLTLNEKTLTLAQWSAATGLKHTTIQMRIDAYGWSVERALTTPAGTLFGK